MEVPTRRHRAPTGIAPPSGILRVGRRTRITRTLAGLVAIAGLAAACVAPTVGGPGGPPSGQPASPGPPTTAPSARPTAPPPGPASMPPGLAGTSWVAPGPAGSWVAGITGSEHRLAIPDGELPIEAAGGLVASVAHREDQSGSTLRVRDIASERLISEVSRDENISSVVFVGDRILAAGHDPVRTGVDPGVVAISLADGSATQLIEPGPAPNGWTASVARSVIASPSGMTVASALCLMDRCALDVVEPASGSIRRVIDEIEAFPRLVTDDVLIVGADDLSRIEAYELETGRRLWERTGAEFQYGYLTSDGRYVLSYIDHREPWRFVVSVIDSLTGEERVLLERDPNEGLRLWPELSNDELAVLGTGGRFEDVSSGSPVVHASVLDLATGALDPGGFTIVVAV